MQGKLRVSLRERGSPQVISRADWARSNCGSDANELERIGVVKIQHSGEYILLTPKTLIGVLDSPHLRLEVLAKSPDLASGLLQRLDDWRKRLNVDVSSKRGNLAEGTSLWSTFDHLLSRVHHEGLPWKYATITLATSAPRGRIGFRETLSTLIAKGVNHKVVTSQQIRNYFVDFAPALEAVRRRISSLEAGDPILRSRVVKLIDLSGDFSIPVDDLEARITFRTLTELEGRPALLALSNFCHQVLAGEDYVRISQRIGRGIAEFVDMEKLWEIAVQMLFMQQHTSSDEMTILHPLRGSGRTLFDDGGPEIDPDIIFYRRTRPVAVIDAKYSVTSHPSAADVYQLSSYVSRMKCDIGILAYLADGPDTYITKIGTLDGGRGLFACYLSLDAFDASNRTLASLLPPEGLPIEVA
ncbi:MAG: hypothetical protein OZ926_12975 [Pseudomonas sp.]|nr:hypothetical protein [Pseudomonas sp.]